MMEKENIRQFKLNNGEEIICEVMQWDIEDDSTIIIRCSMKLIESMRTGSGLRLFSFTPWMSFIDDPGVLQTICSDHILGEVTPSNELLGMYTKCLKKYKVFLNERNNQKLEPINLEDVADLTEDELEKFLKGHKQLFKDSDNSNVIQFPKILH